MINECLKRIGGKKKKVIKLFFRRKKINFKPVSFPILKRVFPHLPAETILIQPISQPSSLIFQLKFDYTEKDKYAKRNLGYREKKRRN